MTALEVVFWYDVDKSFWYCMVGFYFSFCVAHRRLSFTFFASSTLLLRLSTSSCVALRVVPSLLIGQPFPWNVSLDVGRHPLGASVGAVSHHLAINESYVSLGEEQVKGKAQPYFQVSSNRRTTRIFIDFLLFCHSAAVTGTVLVSPCLAGDWCLGLDSSFDRVPFRRQHRVSSPSSSTGTIHSRVPSEPAISGLRQDSSWTWRWVCRTSLLTGNEAVIVVSPGLRRGSRQNEALHSGSLPSAHCPSSPLASSAFPDLGFAARGLALNALITGRWWRSSLVRSSGTSVSVHEAHQVTDYQQKPAGNEAILFGQHALPQRSLHSTH